MRYKLNMGYKKYKLCKGYKMDKEVEEVIGIQQGGRRGVQVVIMMRVLLPHATSGTRKVLT